MRADFTASCRPLKAFRKVSRDLQARLDARTDTGDTAAKACGVVICTSSTCNEVISETEGRGAKRKADEGAGSRVWMFWKDVAQPAEVPPPPSLCSCFGMISHPSILAGR